MLREVRLVGALGERFGRVHHFAVGSASEAIRAMCTQFEGFERELMQSHERGVGYRVLVGGRAQAAEALANPSSWREPIRLVPVMTGAGRGWGTILLGVVLVVASFYTGGLAAAGGGTTSGFLTAGGVAAGTAATISGAMFSIGVSLTLSGVTSLLAPSPRALAPAEDDKHKPSYLFDGPVNTIAQGHPVPLGYGRLIVGAAQVSGGIASA
jgi:predicted phage tail protein